MQNYSLLYLQGILHDPVLEEQVLLLRDKRGRVAFTLIAQLHNLSKDVL